MNQYLMQQMGTIIGQMPDLTTEERMVIFRVMRDVYQRGAAMGASATPDLRWAELMTTVQPSSN